MLASGLLSKCGKERGVSLKRERDKEQRKPSESLKLMFVGSTAKC